jgi:hypothetical protein
MRSIPIFVLLCFASVGCATLSHQIYLGPELPEVSPSDLRAPATRKLLNLETACSFSEEVLPQVGALWSEAHRAAVHADFRETRCGQLTSIVYEVFSQYTSFLPTENVDRLTIKLDVRGSGGAPGFTEAAPSGDLAMEAEYTPVGRPPVRRQYRGSFYWWAPLPTWRRVPHGARQVDELRFGGGDPRPFFRRAEERIARDMALNLVRDLQQSGEL